MDNVDNNKVKNHDLPQVNLNAFADTEKYSLEIKTKEKEHPDDAKLRRFKDKGLFIATLASISVAFCTCIGFLILNHDSQYTGIALNGVIGLTMALTGYYVRGKTN